MNLPETLLNIEVPDRPRDGHKGSFGHVFVIAGSPGMTGAACLCSEAALRAGCGIVTLGVSSSINSICEIKLTEVMTKILPETESGTLSLSAKDLIMEFSEQVDVLVIGPGLSNSEPTRQLVRFLVGEITKPMIIDADGLNAISDSLDCLSDRKGVDLVVTPHPGEMSRLKKLDVNTIQADRVYAAVDFSQRFSICTVLKGCDTVVTSPKGESYINETGNSGMATAGSGDVLSGVIAGLIAQGFSAYDAACLGVYLHGLSGDLAQKELGAYSMIAGDVLKKIPLAFKAVFE